MVAKMTNKTEIFNDVCLLLGITPDIQDADTDDGDNAVAFRAAYSGSRRTVLRDHPWGFANKRAVLTVIGTAPSDWKYQYAYPADCVKAIEIQKANRTDKPIPFKVAQYYDTDNGKVKVILTDQPEAILIYTADEDDPSLFDEQYKDALVGLIAFKCSKLRSTDKDAQERAWNAYQRAKFAATSSDGNEQVPDDGRDPDWLSGRN